MFIKVESDRFHFMWLIIEELLLFQFIIQFSHKCCSHFDWGSRCPWTRNWSDVCHSPCFMFATRSVSYPHLKVGAWGISFWEHENINKLNFFLHVVACILSLSRSNFKNTVNFSFTSNNYRKRFCQNLIFGHGFSILTLISKYRKN